MNFFLHVKKLSDDAFIPQKGSQSAAGYDLVSPIDLIIEPHNKALIPLNIAIAIPEGCYGRIAPRSGLAVKYSIDVGAGVIDNDYRGNVGVLLFNLGNNNFYIKRGDRIAQLILEQYKDMPIQEVTELPETIRGIGGFGSTGTNFNDINK